MQTSTEIDGFRQKLLELVAKFDKDKSHYLSKGYPEAQVRLDFLNPFFKALGWDIENKGHKPPHERDVIVELSPETTGRPDYNFRISGSTKFFVEAKAPSIALSTQYTPCSMKLSKQESPSSLISLSAINMILPHNAIFNIRISDYQ